MTPQKQQNRHRPEVGILGDCYRTAVACALDLPRDEVPHVHEHVGAADMQAQTKMMDDFLRTHSRPLRTISLPWHGETPLQLILDQVELVNPGLTFLLTGTSPRGTNHTVVCQGGKIACDPAIDGGDLVGPADDGNWWVEFLGADL